MEKKITIENDVPHLIEALWHHRDCPVWLHDVLWEGINDRVDGGTKMTATYWASCLESAQPDTPNEIEYDFPAEVQR